MERLVIEGGARLSGEISVAGAKNATLPLMSAGLLLSDGKLVIRNTPRVQDIRTMARLLELLGVDVLLKEDSVEINPSGLLRTEADQDAVKAMRASVLVLGPLISRFGSAKIPLPGGCAIGARPIDQHLAVLKAMGADVKMNEGFVSLKADSLKGVEFTFKIPTVTGTENAMMAGVLARGETVLHNCAKEPEISELANVLNKMGAEIHGAGTETIIIQGVSSLRGIEHRVMSDRIEAATFLIAGALAGEKVRLNGISPELIRAVIAKLRAAGVQLEEQENAVTVWGAEGLKAVDVRTGVYPGFPTDVQAQFMALMCFADGESIIEENIFENRFLHVKELKNMGADIRLDGRLAIVKGVKRLSGARVTATDLRASASLVIAGLGAEGRTEIESIEHLDRGYEKIENKMSSLGARIKRVVE